MSRRSSSRISLGPRLAGWALLGVAVAVAVAVAGCGLFPSLQSDRPVLGISNGTTLEVTLVVNGSVVAVLAPGEGTSMADEASLPDLPWFVEARSPTGRVLTSMQVLPGQVTSNTRPDGGGELHGVGGRVDLSCGRLDIWAGPPMGGPPPGPGVPGDCRP